MGKKCAQLTDGFFFFLALEMGRKALDFGLDRSGGLNDNNDHYRLNIYPK